MNGNYITSNIKYLKFTYIIQMLLYGLIFAFNFYLISKIVWLNTMAYYLYLSISFFGIIYFLLPLVTLVYIQIKKLTQKNIKLLKIFSVTFCIIAIITGLCFTFILMMNSLELGDFCRECPFNLPDSYINIIYKSYINNNSKKNVLKEQCSYRRCLFINQIYESQDTYEYICNYYPTTEFGAYNMNNNTIRNSNEIKCQNVENELITIFNFEKKEINKYLEMCSSFSNFYICQRIKQPKIYSIKEDYKCPKKDYMTNFILYCMLSILFNLILNFILWKCGYTKYKNILISLREININRMYSTSLNSTKNTAKIQNEIKEESFKKEKTETIIVYTEENMINEINNSNNNYIGENNKNILIIGNMIINQNKNIRNVLKINDENNEDNLSTNDEYKNTEMNTIKIYKIDEKISNIEEKEEKNKEINNNIFISNSCYISSSERNIEKDNQKIPKI